MTLDGVDPSRVAMGGIGHADGAVMIAAGGDPRVKAVAYPPGAPGRAPATARYSGLNSPGLLIALGFEGTGTCT
jgi:hypothetical protein